MLLKPFDYYELRPCVEFEDHIQAFLGHAVYCPTRGGVIHTPEQAEAEARIVAEASGRPMFWTLYGVSDTATAIGNFKTFDAAYAVMVAILMPLRHAADTGDTVPLEDICNQSSTEERL